MFLKLVTACLVGVALPGSALAASTVTYSYDVFGQLVSLSSSSGPTATYSYDAAGNRTQLTSTGSVALNKANPGVSLATAEKTPSQSTQPSRLDDRPAAAETASFQSARAGGVELVKVSAIGAGQ